MPRASLTPRQREIVGCICEGLPRKEIAARLGISEDTVKNQITEINYRWGTRDMRDIAIHVATHTPSVFTHRRRPPATITPYG